MRNHCLWSRVRLLPSRILAAVLFAAALLLPCRAQEMNEGRDFTLRECYAHFTGTQLMIGNSHVRRTWRIEHGHLFATSLIDLEQKVEWINLPSSLPSPAPPVQAGDGPVVFRGGSGTFGPTEAESLRVELEETASGAVVDYEFQIFPQASGIRMWVALKRSGAAPVSAAAADTTSNTQPVNDALERLQITRPHLRLTQVTMLDRTDQRNELVFENEWLLHPNESLLELQGNVFLLEDTLTGDGLVFLKEAPQPEMRPLKTPFDAWFSGAGMIAPEDIDRHLAPHFTISFYGHGFAGSGQGYPYTLMAYHGGRAGRIAALHLYQRQIRQYEPARDGQLLSNTWGDRSRGTKLNQDFVHQEIDAAKALGVDIVQIDDGWELGKTAATTGSGVWNDYWSTNSHFWAADPVRFPNGLSNLSNYAHAHGVKLGLWFAPDSHQDFVNWRKDAEQVLAWNREEHVDTFKLDSVKIESKAGENNYRALLDWIQKQSSGKILLDLDVTAETRQGYFGNIAAGPLFVENRYTDFHRYWPHHTLRNFWRLSQYVDPVRLRMEFLNSERNAALYPDDALAPAHYRPSCLFAMTMFGSPLAFLENTGLSASYVADASPLIARWKTEREAVYRGTIVPIGDVPDGVTWTGFASVAEGRRGGYLLMFRELNQRATDVVPRSLFAEGNYQIRLLGGEGKVTEVSDGFRVNIPQPLGFVWVRLAPVR